MTIAYPDKPWTDGQSFTYITTNGDELVGVYYKATNSWTFATAENTPSEGDVLTTNVLATERAGNVRAGELHFDRSMPTYDEVVTQQDVNWYLYDEIVKLQALIEDLS